jgi:hypothetical protein
LGRLWPIRLPAFDFRGHFFGKKLGGARLVGLLFVTFFRPPFFIQCGAPHFGAAASERKKEEEQGSTPEDQTFHSVYYHIHWNERDGILVEKSGNTTVFRHFPIFNGLKTWR